MTDNPLTAQQLQAIRNEASASLQAAVDRMQLRKWAVEQAFILMTSTNLKDWMSRDEAPDDVMAVVNGIYEFVSKAAVVKVDINQL